MASLMDAIGAKTQVIIVGDVDQLPSVGPGRVLSGMIESGMLPVSRLRTLHRQAGETMINVNAKRINAGEPIKVDNTLKTDFWFVPEEDKDKIPGVMVQVCRRIPETFGFTLDGIQILCPQKKGRIGTMEVSKALRPVLNPNGKPISGLVYEVGDRVIQLRNNYDLEIFNGDIGKVRGLSKDKECLVVELEDVHAARIVNIPLADLEDLQLAHALTVHKSQGSEFPCVIMPVHTTNHIMLQHNLLYTAVTRARKMIVLVGALKGVNTAIRTLDSSTRWSNLEKFIVDGVFIQTRRGPSSRLNVGSEMQPRWLKASEACAHISVSRNTLKRMLREGLVGERTPGGHCRVDRESLDAFFERGSEKALAIVRSLRQ